MRFKAIVAVATALTMSATPALAAANPAGNLSVARAMRAPAKTTNGSKFVFTTQIFEIGIAIAIITATVLVISDNSNKPKSP